MRAGVYAALRGGTAIEASNLYSDMTQAAFRLEDLMTGVFTLLVHTR